MNEMHRDHINTICGKITSYIGEKDITDITLMMFDLDDISIICVRGGNAIFTIKIMHNETTGVIFNEADTDRFDLTDYGIAKCVDIAKRYIDWECK